MSDARKPSEKPNGFDGIVERATGVIHNFGTEFPQDLESARAIATAAIEIYGDLDGEEYKRFKAEGIWNDHAAVQAALAAIRMFRQDISPARLGRL